MNFATRPSKKDFQFIFIEKRIDRAENLEKLLALKIKGCPSCIHCCVIKTEFESFMNSVIDDLEKSGKSMAPLFCFIDPFGYSGIPMELMKRILDQTKPELLITFMDGYLTRFSQVEDSREDEIDRLFGTNEWRSVRSLSEDESKNDHIISLYKTQLEKAGASYVRSFTMRGLKNVPLFNLIFATKHPKGLEAMKESMFKVDRTGQYTFLDTTDPRQTLLLDYSDETHWVPVASTMLYKNFKGRTVTMNDCWHYVITQTPYLFRRAILKGLKNEGKIAVTGGGPRGGFTDECKISFIS